MPHKAAVLRILDAALNRAAEALRVVEDHARFALDDAHLTYLLKTLRHDLAAASAEIPRTARGEVRDTLADVGATIATVAESFRTDADHVCHANCERAKQSLRTLEEHSKTLSPQLAARFEAMRYRFYTIEAALIRTADALDRLADVRLYVLIDGGPSEEAFAKLAQALLDSGVDAIQLRDKQLDDRTLLARAKLLQSLMSVPSGAPPLVEKARKSFNAAQASPPHKPLLIVNDRPDLAAAANADGVHLGQDDLPAKEARAILGPGKLIGVSTHSLEQARAAALAGANYIGVGPTFPSQTKSFADFPGLELLRAVAAEIRLPAFAIGGIDERNLPQVLAAGFTRVAVSSAVTASESPGQASRRLHALLNSPGDAPPPPQV